MHRARKAPLAHGISKQSSIRYLDGNRAQQHVQLRKKTQSTTQAGAAGGAIRASKRLESDLHDHRMAFVSLTRYEAASSSAEEWQRWLSTTLAEA
mmetsp:Transcript_24088/g.61547  ORF Transcript_24088/g.61547 Transcript_24088/m.61547 type:complete len:95 (+) Transcript_24088:254-538(+)